MDVHDKYLTEKSPTTKNLTDDYWTALKSVEKLRKTMMEYKNEKYEDYLDIEFDVWNQISGMIKRSTIGKFK